MSGQYFFRQPFAASGDKTAIPQTTGDGTVNYNVGWGPDYSLDPATDPDAKRVPRDQTNQFYYDVTDNLRQYQLTGTPEFVTSAQNGGSAVAYAIGARVRLGDVTYTSLVAANTATPGADPTKWRPTDAFSLTDGIAQPLDYTTPASNILLTTPGNLSRALRQADMTFAAAALIGSAYTVTLPGQTFAQGVGALVEFTVPSASPAGPVTLKVNALATRPLQTNVETDPIAGDLVPGRVYIARSTGSKWLLVAPVASQLASAPITIPDRLAAQTAPVAFISDYNAVLENGWYFANPGLPNGATPLVAATVYLRVQASSADLVTQIATGLDQTEANTRTYQRTRTAGVWGPWYRLRQSAPEIQTIAVPAGVEAYHAGLSAPNGWLVRDGSAVSRTTYFALFAAIGTLYGAGDGSTTFNLPDDLTPGNFTRAGTPDAVNYADTVGPHQHQLPVRSNANSANGFVEDADSSGTAQTAYTEASGPNIGAETAPRHSRKLPIIKF